MLADGDAGKVVDLQPGAALQFLPLAEGAVPHCAAVGGAVSVAGGGDGQDACTAFLAGPALQQHRLQQLGLAGPVPPNLRWRGAPGAAAGQVEGFTLHGDGAGGGNAGRGGRQQHSQPHTLGVHRPPSPRLFYHAFEVSVVPVVSCVLYFEVVLAAGREAFNPDRSMYRKHTKIKLIDANIDFFFG